MGDVEAKTMTLSDAERAVLDYLATAPGPVIRGGRVRGWVSEGRSGGGPGADPATARFLRCRQFPQCDLHAVSFSTYDSQAMHWILRTVKNPSGGWSVLPIGGGGGGAPVRTRPWVNFTAQWSPQMFAAGGWVTGDGHERARLVRLTFTGGTPMEDRPTAGVVLFYVPRGVTFPAHVEILDDAGTTLAAYDEFAEWAERNGPTN